VTRSFAKKLTKTGDKTKKVATDLKAQKTYIKAGFKTQKTYIKSRQKVENMYIKAHILQAL
jgi:hypothetical protein